MREIKFRVWNTDYKDPIMEYFDPRKESSKLNRNYLYKFSDKDWMQYTGLKDKNGKEIYEGDILQSEFTGEFDLVEWETDEDGSFLYSGWRCLSDGEYTEDRVVAGNIHENPELLNSEEEETGK